MAGDDSTADAEPPGHPEPASPADLLDRTSPPGHRFALTVVGDVRLELRTEVPDRSFRELDHDHLTYAPVRFVVSGTAVNLARHARAHFARIEVVAKVGDDAFTRIVEDELGRLGVGGRLHVQKGMASGFTLMLRDAAGEERDSVRLLVASDPAPGGCLTVQDVRDSKDVLERTDAVFCDGYSLLSATSRAAVAEALALARAAGVRTAFDLVPHDIHHRLPPGLVWPVLESADIVIVEAATAAGLVGLPRPAPHPVPPPALLAALDEALPGRPLWLLRYGEGGMENSLAYRHGELMLSYDTGYTAAADKAGVGDRIAAAELYWQLSAGTGRG